jgi:hypothetical protein
MNLNFKGAAMQFRITQFSSVIAISGLVFLTGCQRGSAPETAQSAAPKKPTAKPVPTQKHEEHDEGSHEHFAAKGTLVTNHGIPLLRESQTAGGFTPERRAQIVAERLNNMATTHGLESEVVFMRRVNGVPTVFFFHEHSRDNKGHVLATIDFMTAKQFGFANAPETLAYWWRDVLRDHALIVEGNPPRWTIRYAQPIQQLYNLTQKERRGVPSHESFERALSKLTDPERDILTSLYVSVPSNYKPMSDDAPQTRKQVKAEKKSGGGKRHTEEHQHHD